MTHHFLLFRRPWSLIHEKPLFRSRRAWEILGSQGTGVHHRFRRTYVDPSMARDLLKRCFQGGIKVVGKTRSFSRVGLNGALETAGGGGESFEAEHTGAPGERVRRDGEFVARTRDSVPCS